LRKLLVTGAAGFIGRALVKRLRQTDNTVIEFDLDRGDITVPDALRAFESNPVDYVFHLAGKTFVPESWKDPYSFFQVNALGTLNVLELCRKTGAGLTYLSSYLYGEPDYLPIDEEHPVKSYNPYSQSKVIADTTCQFYSKHFQMPITIFRPFNVYGPGQSSLFLISEIISKVMDSTVQEVEVMDLRPRRDYIYIDDLVDALILSVGKPHGIFNLGSGYSVSVEEIIKLVMKHAGITKPYHSKGITRQNEIFDLFANIGKACQALNWEPHTTFEAGIIQCIGAFTSNR
jgi:nucleoside-diphosphate-sugar epimerase